MGDLFPDLISCFGRPVLGDPCSVALQLPGRYDVLSLVFLGLPSCSVSVFVGFFLPGAVVLVWLHGGVWGFVTEWSFRYANLF